MKGLHTLTFDPAAFSDEERVFAWMRFFSKISAIVPLPADPFLPRASVWIAERVTFTYAKNHPQYHESEAAAGFNLEQRDQILAFTCTKGLGQYLHDGEIFSIRPGDVFLMDVARDVRVFMTDAEMYSVVVPHSSVGYQPDAHAAHALFRAPSPTATVFRDWVFSKFPAFPETSRSAAPEVALSAKTLIRDMLDAANAQSDTPPTFSERIIDYVDEHMFEIDLTPDTLMRTFELSRAKLYELSGFSNGLDAYVSAARLEYALRSLVYGPKTPHRLEWVAERLNYPSVSAFSGAFTAQFGFSPDLVIGLLTRARPEPANKLWDTWLSDDQGAL
ncbi:MAG: hypothetical protein Hens2KO_22210 [Henriciella sp.]